MSDAVSVRFRSAWGKSASQGKCTHHLAHHSADVAAVFLALLEAPAWGARAQAAARRPDLLTFQEIRCLAALAFLHDIGKLAPGFQAKAWPEGHGIRLRGHLECGWHWANMPRADALAGAVVHLETWPDMELWFMALMAHHGRPVPAPIEGGAEAAFPCYPDYDWLAEEAVLGRALLNWFPEIISAHPPSPDPPFLHFFCGMLTLADWVASDRRAFPFEAQFQENYWTVAKERAAARCASIGLSAGPALSGPADFRLISDHASPRPAQLSVGALPCDERLILLEAETGAGKTEAALWRFAKLVEAGAVDALYFAVPSRAAARQLHRRINAALAKMFDVPPEAVLAIPGQAVAGEATGKRLPDFSVLWDDAKEKPARWAAEHSARYLAARVAVGTVDQVALGGLQVKYAHLRGASLSRALLVIDEVHASDIYMTETQLSLVRSHLDLGGHVLLMSATLGAAARRRWRGETAQDLATDAGLAYPAVWTSKGLHPVAADPSGGKTLEITAHEGWSGANAAALAVQAALRGARVLVIRNTVIRAQETFAAVESEARHLLLQINGIATLHHSRFSAEDRALLDCAVENAIGKDSSLGGRIVIGTQSLEQSLDLCADFLITDLCPMDVLLQRIGRLHRHRRARPEGFARARAIVLCPPGGLDPLTRAADNGLGAYAGGPSLSGVYVNVPGLEATLEQIRSRPVWQIPEMNRTLVEAATHPEALETVVERLGWQAYHQRVTGKALAEMRTAGLCLLDRNAPLATFPDDEKIRTRLGEEGVVLRLPEGLIGPFGSQIRSLALPAHWSRGLTGKEAVTIASNKPLIMTVSDMMLSYGPSGVTLGGTDGA